MSNRRELAIDCAAIVAIKIAVSLLVLLLGFTHVSDDDYSRIVIAQLWAHVPKLDPSGTSWLPFPFWVNGIVMMIFGRSLEVARVIAVALSALAATAPYLGARSMEMKRTPALLGAVIVSCTPVCAWLGAATVPEGFAGLITAGGILAIASGKPRASLGGAIGLCCASLSRYESWPACAIAAIVLVLRAKDAPRTWLVPALVCALGPCAWMLWNQHAHGSFVHFFARVSAYHAAHTTAMPFATLLWNETMSLVSSFPEIVAYAFALAMVVHRGRWTLVATCALATLVFLFVGDLRGGAPTHHPERAFVPIVAMLAFPLCEALALPRRALALAGGWFLLFAWRVRAFPGASASEDRSDQIARGRALRNRDHLMVTPCAYEHFALMASYGAPEKITIRAPTLAAACPEVLLSPDPQRYE